MEVKEHMFCLAIIMKRWRVPGKKLDVKDLILPGTCYEKMISAWDSAGVFMTRWRVPVKIRRWRTLFCKALVTKRWKVPSKVRKWKTLSWFSFTHFVAFPPAYNVSHVFVKWQKWSMLFMMVKFGNLCAMSHFDEMSRFTHISRHKLLVPRHQKLSHTPAWNLVFLH